MLAPTGYFQSVDRDGYVKAQLVVSRRVGALRFTAPALVLSAILVVSGLQVMFGGARTVSALMSGIVLFCMAAILAANHLYILPEAVKAIAQKEFDCYNKLSNHVTVTFTSEEVVLQNERLTRRAEFAKTRLCIETPDRFILIADDDTVILLEKVRFENRSATEEFLRDVCARWYVKKGG